MEGGVWMEASGWMEGGWMEGGVWNGGRLVGGRGLDGGKWLDGGRLDGGMDGVNMVRFARFDVAYRFGPGWRGWMEGLAQWKRVEAEGGALIKGTGWMEVSGWRAAGWRAGFGWREVAGWRAAWMA